MTTADIANDFDRATLQAVRHYLDRIQHILERVSREPSREALLAIRIAPDAFQTGFHFAVAIQFAARALCPPAGRSIPSVPEDCTSEALLAFVDEVREVIESIAANELTGPVTHDAGRATLELDAPDHVLRFAFPNMLFHLSLAYAGLRSGGMAIGKADFDGLHAY